MEASVITPSVKNFQEDQLNSSRFAWFLGEIKNSRRSSVFPGVVDTLLCHLAPKVLFWNKRKKKTRGELRHPCSHRKRPLKYCWCYCTFIGVHNTVARWVSPETQLCNCPPHVLACDSNSASDDVFCSTWFMSCKANCMAIKQKRGETC